MSEQPEVPQLVSDENDLLAGSAEDQQIGREPEPPKLTAEQVQALQTSALIDLAKSIKGLVERQEATRQVPYNEIKPVTPFNPEGKRDRVKLTRNLFMSGIMVQSINLTEGEIELINQLKPGRYIERKVEVQLSRDGSTLSIMWPNGKIDKRMEFQSRFPTASDLFKAIIAERKDKEEKRRRGVVAENEEL